MKKTLLSIALATSVGAVNAAPMTSATFTMLDSNGNLVGTFPDVVGDIGGGTELTVKGNLIGFGSATEECVLDKTDDKILTVDSTATCGLA